MALAAATVWEVRSTGSDNNGGGYAGGGTDFSMQDTPRATLTVASVVHTTTTQINVAAGDYTVGAGDVGNLVQVTGGTATAGFYHISAVDVPNNRWTVDRAAGTAGQTVVGAMGGALASPGKCGSAFIAGNTMWVKAATYAITSATNNIAGGCVSLPTAGSGTASRMSGYSTTRGDGGRPTLQASGAITTFTLVASGNGNTLEHLIFDGASKTSSRGATPNNGRAIRCKAINCTNVGLSGGMLIECEASGCSGSNTAGLNAQSALGCWSHDNLTNCHGFLGAGANSALVSCIASNNSGSGFHDGGTATRFMNCTSYGNTGNGFTSTLGAGLAPTGWLNCVAYGNTGAGIATGVNPSTSVQLAFLGANTGGATTGAGNVVDTVTLTANPFVDAAGNNFALNNTAGGGALVRAAAIPSAFPGGLTTSYLDGGAAQHQEPAAPTFPPASKVYAGTDRGDGVIGTLHASNIATAAGAGVNLTAAILLSGSTVDDVVGAVTLPPANKLYAGTNRGDGVTGTLHASNIATAAGAGVNLTPSILLQGNTVDDVTGTHTEAPAPTFPPASKVYAGVDRGDGTLGTLHASNIAAAAGAGSNLAAGDLRSGVTVDDVIGALNPGGVAGGAYTFVS